MTKANKAIGGGVGGAAAIILAWVVSLAGVEMPAEVQMALTILLPGVGAYFAPANAS